MASIAPLEGPFRNALLSRLFAASDNRDRIDLERLTLKVRAVIHEPDGPFGHVYFPESGVASLLTVLKDGTQTQSGTIGIVLGCGEGARPCAHAPDGTIGRLQLAPRSEPALRAGCS